MKLNYKYKTELIEFELVFSKRKTVGIKISPPGDITVMAPYKASQVSIISLVQSKSEWIIKKLEEIKQRENLKPEHSFQNGDSFLYLGNSYDLDIIIDKPNLSRVLLDNNILHIVTTNSNPSDIHKQLENWYKIRAINIINERISHYQFNFNYYPNKVTVKTQNKRWGSCNSRRELYFNWKIVMAPVEIIDYVVVHEMCHMVHMNHSKDFWNLVEKLLPDHRLRREWLKNNGNCLVL